MLFTSQTFLLIFLPIVFGIFCALNKIHSVKILSLWLLLASWIFYLCWQPLDLLPLIISILINFLIYQIMHTVNPRRKAYVLTLGILFNLILLAYYKYLTSFISHISGSNAIPLGISFYTFTQIAFLFDCYRETYKKNDFINYALFVSYFPHLVCGPILSFKNLYPQLNDEKKLTVKSENIALFLFCFSIGFFKKLFIADEFGDFVNSIFDTHQNDFLSQKSALLGILAYSLQLYFDFSAYSDMAVGLSYLFGLTIPDNFNSPYQAVSIIDFWRRWHISLSTFLKNYLYIPLGGNKRHHYLNLMITMLLGGLWHGPAFTYIAWGFYQGLLLACNHLIRNIFKANANANRSCVQSAYFKILLKRLFIFTLIALGWVLFRSPNLKSAFNLYSSLFFDHSNAITVDTSFSKTILYIALVWVFFLPDTIHLRENFLKFFTKKSYRFIEITAFSTALLATLGAISLNRIQHFLYAGF